MVQKNKDMTKLKSKPKKYVAIVKIGNNSNGTAFCVKYRFDDLLKFTDFLDVKWNSWRWFNVFANCGGNKGQQLTSFTNKKRPTTKTL